MSYLFARVRLLAPLTLTCASLLAAAMGWPGTTLAESAPSASLALIAPGQIPAQADAAETALHDMIERANRGQADGQLDPANSRLSRLIEGIDRLRAQPDMSHLDAVPMRRLDALQLHWQFYASELERLRADLARRVAGLSADAADLQQLRAVWSATREQSITASLAQPLAVRIDGVLTLVGLADHALEPPLTAMLSAQERLATYEQRVNRSLQEVAAAVDYTSRRLFAIDSPPLWSDWTTDATVERNRTLSDARWRDESQFLQEYLQARRGLLEGFAAYAVAVVALVMWLRLRSRDWLQKDNQLHDRAQLLLRPVSAALLLILLGGMFFFGRAPLIVFELLLLGMLIPVLRLSPDRLLRQSRGPLYGLAALFVMDRLKILVIGTVVGHRAHLLAITALGLAGLWWIVRRYRAPAADVQGPWIRAVAKIAALASVILACSLIANVVGNVTLADVLTSATLNSTFLAVVLFAGTSVLEDVLALFFDTRSARTLKIVSLHGATVLRRLAKLIHLLAFMLWLVATLKQFKIYTAIEERVLAVLERTWTIGALPLSLGGILLFAVSIWAATQLARLIRFVIDEELLTRVDWPTGVESAISMLSYYALLAIGFIAAMAAAGFEVGQFALIAGALGVGIGFGLQNIVNNFVSGLILMFERPIQPGDLVEVGGVQGRVRVIGLRATRIQTGDGADAIIPNGTLLSSNLTNWTLSDRNRRIDMTVGVAYGTNVRLVLEILLETARKQPRALTRPEPTATFAGFGDSTLNFTLQFWTGDFDGWGQVRSQTYVDLNEALHAAGIEIPAPQRDLHLRSISEDARVALLSPQPAAEPRTDR